MIKLAECSLVVRSIVSAAAIISALAVCAGAAAWAGDTRWVTVTAQAESEQRQLKREIKKFQLEVDAGTASPTDEAYLKFLEQDLESLEAAPGG